MKAISVIMVVLLFAVLGCPARTEVSDNQATESKESEQTGVPGQKRVDESRDYVSGEWITDYDLAVKYAQSSGLPIMINFTGSDWCIWCIRLKDEVFSKEVFQDYAKENLILLELDFPRNIPQTEAMKQANANLRGRFNVRGYPTIVLMDKDQKEIARTGYQHGGAAAYVIHVEELLKK